MFEITIENLVSGLGAALVTALIGYYTVVRKAKADETAIALNAWKELLAPLKEELAAAKTEITKLREALEQAEIRHRKETDKLISRIRETEKRV